MNSAALGDASPLNGVQPRAVVDALKARRARWDAGDRSEDGRKIGLVVEGGAMRGIHSAGGVVALGHLGYTDLFDAVYATSAGALNAAYFLSHQAEMGITIYFENLITKRFLNPLRFWKMLDVDYVFDHVVTVDKPLDVDRILAGHPDFLVALMDRKDGTGFTVDVKRTTAPLLRVLKAATAIPVLYNRTVDMDGRRCMDGGLQIPFPIEEAIAGGCTDILVLLTRPVAFICPTAGRGTRLIFGAVCSRGNRGLSQAYLRGGARENTTRDLALGRGQVPTTVNIATLCPDQPERIHQTTGDVDALHQAAVLYGRQLIRIFDADPAAWTLAPVRRR